MIKHAVRIVVIMTAIICLALSAFCGAALAQLDNPDLPRRTGLKVSEFGIKAGDIRLHGALKSSEELETNIFLTPSKDKIDGITMLKPSVGIEIPFLRNMISADYEVGAFMYGHYNSQNHIDQQARGLIELNLTDYKIKVKNTFQQYTDRASDENSRRITHGDNTFRASVGAQFDKLGFELGYTNLLETYGSSDDLIFQSVSYGDRDRDRNIVDGTISYRFLPKTTAFLESDLGFIHYYNSSIPPDSIFLDTYLGLKGRLTNKILINLKAGFRYQNYGSSDIYADKFYFGPIAKGGLDFSITKDDILNLSVEKLLYESLYANMNYFDDNILGLKYTHKFNEKMLFTAYSSYQLNLYPGATNERGLIAKRYDNYYNFGFLGRYDIRRWLSAELRYDFTQKSSRFHIYDYTDHRVSLSGTAGF